MYYSDIHTHALCGCDDGAKTPEDMYKMIVTSYCDGVRYVCLTPHYNPGYFGENSIKAKESYQLLLEYVKKELPDLNLALGNELRYNVGCEEWLSNENFRCMNDTKYVLVDFFEGDKKDTISKGLDKFLSSGYIPILAHAERYRCLRGDLSFIKEHRNNGVLIQVDAGSIFGEFGWATGMFCKKMLKNYLVDFVASDAHSPIRKYPGIKEAYEYIKNKYGADYAEAICFKNAFHIIFEN